MAGVNPFRPCRIYDITPQRERAGRRTFRRNSTASADRHTRIVGEPQSPSGVLNRTKRWSLRIVLTSGGLIKYPAHVQYLVQ